MTVEQAAELIRRGDVVAFPTETVYGLGADAWNPSALKKIFSLKGRPEDNPLIVHLSDLSQVADFASEIPAPAKKLMKKCWPGPLTLVFKKKPEVLDAITSGLNTVALRIPDHPAALDLIRLTGPLAAPSANLSGRPSPTNPMHVRRDFGQDFPVLEGGKSAVGLESTVLDLTRQPFAVLRPGKYTREQLSQITGGRIEVDQTASEKPGSPGIKYTHYKPEADVEWFDPAKNYDREKVLLITHTGRPAGFPRHAHFQDDFARTGPPSCSPMRLPTESIPISLYRTCSSLVCTPLQQRRSSHQRPESRPTRNPLSADPRFELAPG
jgi:L-threonylcarbamoyladenylate synthase